MSTRRVLFGALLVLSLVLSPRTLSYALFSGDPVGSNRIADIVEKSGEAVVNIDVVRLERRQSVNPFNDFEQFFGFQFQQDPEFRRFFEDRTVPVKGAGSGFIIVRTLRHF